MTNQELIDLASVPAKMPSAFRLYVNEKWMEHKDEILLWTGNVVDYDAKYYYNKHRWLLKSMYKEQKNG